MREWFLSWPKLYVSSSWVAWVHLTFSTWWSEYGLWSTSLNWYCHQKSPENSASVCVPLHFQSWALTNQYHQETCSSSAFHWQFLIAMLWHWFLFAGSWVSLYFGCFNIENINNIGAQFIFIYQIIMRQVLSSSSKYENKVPWNC
jgi:hypothetical protein